MAAPTPADVRAAFAKKQQDELASFEADYAHAVKCLQNVTEYTYAPNEDGKLCGRHILDSRVFDIAKYQPWLRERLARDNPAWNVTVEHLPSKHSDNDSEAYRITLVEK